MGKYVEQRSVAAVKQAKPLSVIRQLLTLRLEGTDERINLRAWFVLFVGYMLLLAAVIFAGSHLARQGKPELGASLWVLGGMMFYLSFCCSFCPLPTAWLILAVGSGEALGHIIGTEWAAALNSAMTGYWKVAAVAGLGGLATSMANLNEYHVFTFLLRYKRIGKVRQMRLYEWAGRWFNKGPFLLLAVFCFVPIPVDVVRWLAISHRYPRAKFFWANILGRGSRYGLMALFSSAMGLGLWSILLIQAALVAIAAKRVLPRICKRTRRDKDT